MFRDLVRKTSGLRRPGSAALDLAWSGGRPPPTASSRSASTPGTSPPGCLLVIEAGGLVSDFAGEENYLKSGNIVAGSPRIFVQLLQTIQPHLTPALRG